MRAAAATLALLAAAGAAVAGPVTSMTISPTTVTPGQEVTLTFKYHASTSNEDPYSLLAGLVNSAPSTGGLGQVLSYQNITGAFGEDTRNRQFSRQITIPSDVLSDPYYNGVDSVTWTIAGATWSVVGASGGLYSQ